jgi:hypothetical protein
LFTCCKDICNDHHLYGVAGYDLTSSYGTTNNKKNMTFSYFPPAELLIDKVAIKFSEKRESVRDKVSMEYKEDNQVIEVEESESEPKVIYQRRDIYGNVGLDKTFFFLGYDENDLLNEVEIHLCDKIKVNDFTFRFNDRLNDVVAGLGKYSEPIQRSEGEYFFKEIKISIMDNSQLGASDDNNLGYFYCADNVVHLEE